MRLTAVLLAGMLTACTAAQAPSNNSTRLAEAGAPGGREAAVNFVLSGTIARVEDGDTLTLQGRSGERFTIRMSDIDTPETFHAKNPYKDRCPAGPTNAPGQPFGKAASASLASLGSIGEAARAECYEVDNYGRLVCHVFVKETNLNLTQIERGWAMTPDNVKWVRDPKSKPAEEQARKSKVGIWAGANPVSPDMWRKSCWCDGACAGAEQ